MIPIEELKSVCHLYPFHNMDVGSVMKLPYSYKNACSVRGAWYSFKKRNKIDWNVKIRHIDDFLIVNRIG